MPETTPVPRTLHRLLLLTTLLLPLTTMATTVAAQAAPRPTSDLLLPYFEVTLDPGKTTFFAITNATAEGLAAEIVVFSNWGIPVLTQDVQLDPGEPFTIDLRQWIVAGRLPGRVLEGETQAHVQAALTGQASPRDGRFYGSEIEPELAVGYVQVRVLGEHVPDALHGDYFIAETGTAAGRDLLRQAAAGPRTPPAADTARVQLAGLNLPTAADLGAILPGAR